MAITEKLRKCKTEIKYILVKCLPKRMAHSIIYYTSHKTRWNYKNPVTFDEKIHWLSVYVYDEKYSRYADKYLVREYVKECGLEHLLVLMYGVYDKFSDIDFSKLPDNFILKATHASGETYYDICRDKKNYDYERARKKFDYALKHKYSNRITREYHYAGIVPRIICEELFPSPPGQERVDDYKVICSFGKPIAVMVCTDRDNGRDFYSTEWEYLDYVKPEYRSHKIHEKPEILETMLDAASRLSRIFPLARVDFYIIRNRLYFGEITLTPYAGNHSILNEKGQIEMGRQVSLRKE